MNEAKISQSQNIPRTIYSMPLIAALFIGSGCAALIYEVVWFQLLGLAIGSSSISLGIILGTFMGGMCLGSLLFPRLASPNWHPLRVYAFLELGIGLAGVLVLLLVPLLSRLYTGWAGQDTAGLFLRGILAAVFLLPPSILMGATLPAVSRWVKMTSKGVSWMGFFYGANIAGAVFGSLLAGFYLLRLYDVATATFVAIVINISVAAISFMLAGASSFSSSESAADKEEVTETPFTRWVIYLVIGLSGMTALASEVIWTRLLSLLFGATVYTFSIILSVFLLGLGIGSTVASAMMRNITRPRLALSVCQLLLSLAMLWTASELLSSLPFWPIDPTLTVDPWLKIKMDLIRTLWAVLPPAILWGASFPFALAAVAKPRQDSGHQVGAVYAANTAGAIIGALGASLILVAWIGTQLSQQLLIGLAIISGLFALALTLGTSPSLRSKLNFAGAVLTILVVCYLAIVNVPNVPKELIAYGRFAPTRGRSVDVIYTGEGITAFVAVSKLPGGTLAYHNAGKVQASEEPVDMRLQRMLGHLTTLVPENPRRFLVIGCGAGVTAGAVSIEPKMEKVTIVEIEPLSPRVAAEHFNQLNHDVVNNPKVEVVIDDGRHYLFTTDEKFDGITSDPLDPWVKGSAALYTQEFFESARQHLNPGGVMTQFVQLYESNEAAVKSEIATFFEVFPYGSIWANTYQNSGYDIVLLGQLEPTRIDVDELLTRIETREYSAIAASLNEIGFSSVLDLLATFAGQATDLQPWLQGATINRDYNLRLQYLAGLGLNSNEAYYIYNDMVAYGPKLPEEMFTGSAALLDTLAKTIKNGQFR
ncbi:fused MFS/spermidine synthase [Chloroflexota bacterium]